MTISSLQGLAYLLSIAEVILALFILWMDPRRNTNLTLALYLFGFAVYSLGVAGMSGAATVDQAAPYTRLISLVAFQVGTGLFVVTVQLFRPQWLRTTAAKVGLIAFVAAPTLLAAIDLIFGTQLVFTGLEPHAYTGGYVDLPRYMNTPLTVALRLIYLFAIQFLQVGLLIYLLARPHTRRQRATLWLLLGIEFGAALIESGLRNTIGLLNSYILLQFTLTAGTTLAVFQTGLLSTRNLARRLGWSTLNQADEDEAAAGNPIKLRGVSVSVKLLVLVTFIVVLIIGMQTWLTVDSALQQNSDTEEDQLFSLYEDYRTQIRNNEDTAASLALAFADRPDVREVFMQRDREVALALLSPVFQTLKADYRVAHLYLEDASANVFLRVHNPANFGDNILYRSTAAEAVAQQHVVAGLEIGPSRLGVRGVAPMFDDTGFFIGTVEVGLDYDQAFVDDLKRRSGSDYRMWVSSQAAAPAGLKPVDGAPVAPLSSLFFYVGTTDQVPPAPAEALARVLATGKSEVAYVTANGEQWATLLAPIQAYPERTVGVMEISQSRTPGLLTLQRSQITIVAVAVGLGLLAFALMWVSTNVAVLRPLRHLTTIAGRQLSGELQARAQLTTRDEFNQLGDTLNSLTDELQESIGTLEQRVSARTEQLRTSAEVGRAAASILDADELLRTVANLITDRFGFYYTAIFTLDDTGKYAVLRAATGEAGRVLKERQHKLEIGGQSMVSAAIVRQQARIELDVGQEAVRFANPLLPETRSEIALPLSVGDRLIGALDVQSTEEAAFDDTNAAVLQSMADQIAVALNNSQLFKRTEAALQDTRNLYRTSQAISTASTSTQILSILQETVVSDANRAGLMLFGPRDERGQVAYAEFAAAWVHPEYAHLMVAIPVGARFTAQQMPLVLLVKPDEPLIVEDAKAPSVPEPLRRLMGRFGAEALISLPLTTGQQQIGLLAFGYQKARTFSQDQAQALLAIASQAANVLQNQRLFVDMQATLQRLDQANRRLTGQAWRDYARSVGGSIQIADAGPGIPADAVARGVTHAETSAPIVVRGEQIGTLGLGDLNPNRQWSASDLALLQAVANEVAIAIDNARLLEQTERRAQREQLITNISRKLLSAGDVHSILRVAGDELARALHVSRTEIKVGTESPDTVTDQA